jgi:hypothetical protein
MRPRCRGSGGTAAPPGGGGSAAGPPAPAAGPRPRRPAPSASSARPGAASESASVRVHACVRACVRAWHPSQPLPPPPPPISPLCVYVRACVRESACVRACTSGDCRLERTDPRSGRGVAWRGVASGGGAHLAAGHEVHAEEELVVVWRVDHLPPPPPPPPPPSPNFRALSSDRGQHRCGDMQRTGMMLYAAYIYIYIYIAYIILYIHTYAAYRHDDALRCRARLCAAVHGTQCTPVRGVRGVRTQCIGDAASAQP